MLEDFEQKEDEELIVIASGTTEDWQQIAIDKAKDILRKRNISQDEQLRTFREINKLVDDYNKEVLIQRREEDYTLIEKVVLVIWWPRTIFRDWYLKKDGYELKAKRRIQLIGLGILLTAFLFVWAKYDWEEQEKRRIEEINNVDITEWEKTYYGVDSSGNILRNKE